MKQLEFVPVYGEQLIGELSLFATNIFRDYFAQYLAPDKLDYLVAHLLSQETLTREINEEGYEFYFAQKAGKRLGFLGIQARPDYLFLSKLYLKESARHQGLGRAEFDFVCQRARKCGLRCIRLTVARDNAPSIACYKHMGLKIIKTLNTDVGAGYQMNDYLMEYIL